jgi:hypothetical protein
MCGASDGVTVLLLRLYPTHPHWVGSGICRRGSMVSNLVSHVSSVRAVDGVLL